MTKYIPPVGYPPGSTAKVSIINNTIMFDIPNHNYIQPVIPGYERFRLPSYSFLIENSEGRKILFDAGLRKDWQNLTPEAIHEIESDTIGIAIEKDVLDILDEGGTRGGDIEALVLSHHHFDHLGDPSRFPPSTSLVVGPGFTKSFMPGYPENLESPVLQTDHEGRKVHEIDFEKSPLSIDSFAAYDYFGDGSFYLLNAPGHTIAHICGLARTTSNPPTFLLMGADSCHHNGELRPSKYHPLPDQILPNPFDPSSSLPCPGACFKQFLKKSGKSTSDAFYDIPKVSAGAAYTHDVEAALSTIASLKEVDRDEDLLIILAHDMSILDTIDMFPKLANDWKEKGWGEHSKWGFLKDFIKLQETL